MSNHYRSLLIIGAILLAITVQLGALGAHALTDRLSPADLRAWNFAVLYQFVHALGMILVAILLHQLGASRILQSAGWIMLLGIFLFSGSIYITALGGPEALGQVAPFGGTSFMLAWVLVAVAAFRAGTLSGKTNQ